MLGFILSKLNLLIMVTAIFAIVSYFSFFVAKSVENREASELLNKFAEETYGVLSSTGLCHQSVIRVPPHISSIGTGELNNRLRFLVNIDKIAGTPTTPTKIIFSILRKKDGTVIDSRSFETQADVRLFQWYPDAAADIDEVSGVAPQNVQINPVSKIPTESILLVKEVLQGKTTLFLIPCSTQSGYCSANYAAAQTKIGRNFNCQTGV